MLNKNRKIAAAVGSLLSAGLAVAAVTSLDSASATSQKHSETFMVVQKATHQYGANKFGGLDVNKAGGKVIGFDAITGTYVPAQQKLIITAAFSRAGGLIYAKATSTSSGAISGKVTGGTGKYKGVSGTLEGQMGDTRSRLTLTYSK
jgi:hypothetical protein